MILKKALEDRNNIYWAGRVAIVVGDIRSAEGAFEYCKAQGADLAAGQLAAFLGRASDAENLIARHYRGIHKWSDSSRHEFVGESLAALAKHDPKATEEIWKQVVKLDNGDIGFLAACCLRDWFLFNGVSPLSSLTSTARAPCSRK